MAILFSKSLPTNELLNSHNNHIVEFNSNNPLTAVSCLITINGLAFEITPNPNGKFRFNFMESVKALINQNNFKDVVIPDIQNNGYVYLDDSLYKVISTSFQISFEGGSTESTSRSYHFTKSVKQPRYKYKPIDKLQFLLPFDSLQTYYAKYFRGFVFDVPLFSNISQTVTVINKTNRLTTELDLQAGVNRIFFSQGERNFTFDDLLPLRFGINELEFHTATDYVTLFIDKSEADCSPYLKFYGSDGYYGYFRFNKIFKQSIKTKTIDTLGSDFEDITLTTSFENITGKNKEIEIKLVAELLTESQLNYLLPLLDSPKVELYMGGLFEKIESDSFFGVSVKDTSYKIIDSKRKLYNFQIDISYKSNTLSL